MAASSHYLIFYDKPSQQVRRIVYDDERELTLADLLIHVPLPNEVAFLFPVAIYATLTSPVEADPTLAAAIAANVAATAVP
jgi:hypothetical protein